MSETEAPTEAPTPKQPVTTKEIIKLVDSQTATTGQEVADLIDSVTRNGVTLPVEMSETKHGRQEGRQFVRFSLDKVGINDIISYLSPETAKSMLQQKLSELCRSWTEAAKRVSGTDGKFVRSVWIELAQTVQVVKESLESLSNQLKDATEDLGTCVDKNYKLLPDAPGTEPGTNQLKFSQAMARWMGLQQRINEMREANAAKAAKKGGKADEEEGI